MIEHSIDANIFFRIFKETDASLRNFIENLGFAVDATVYIECIQGSKSNLEKRKIKNYLNNFPLLPITPKISKQAINLIDTYSNTHGLLLADALIAATALENDLTIVTYNIDDFKFIQGLKYLKPAV
jgi:predicted nucleic acid-binding protein